MKLNVVNVLNEIAREEASVKLLNDSSAFWNLTNDDDVRDAYDYYAHMTHILNEQNWELIEWLDKYNRDYSHVRINKVMSFDEWLEEKNKIDSRYLVYASAA